MRNTVLKMAKKRSMVDASIGLGCLTELFTQDMEENEQPPPSEEPRKYITADQVRVIDDLLKEKEVNLLDFLGWAKADSVAHMSPGKFVQAVDYLRRRKVGAA